jgi:hypothetical protein
MKYISLSNTDKVAIVDNDDFEKLNQYRWRVGPKGAAIRSVLVKENLKLENVLMHRQVLDVITEACQVDHRNHNRLDNRKENLRRCKNIENTRNTRIYSNNKTGYKGVHFHKRFKKYIAYIRVNGKLLHLGYFENAKDGALEYNKAADKHFGEFAKLNVL